MKHQLHQRPLAKSRMVKNVDGTTNRMGKITHTVEMLIQHDRQVNRHVFCDERSSSRVNTLLTNPFPRHVTVTT